MGGGLEVGDGQRGGGDVHVVREVGGATRGGGRWGGWRCVEEIGHIVVVAVVTRGVGWASDGRAATPRHAWRRVRAVTWRRRRMGWDGSGGELSYAMRRVGDMGV